MVKEMTCINCPLGCSLTVTVDGDNINVKGNTCPRGEAYAINEIKDPKRIVTSSVKCEGQKERISCKTFEAIPKDKIFDVMKEIKKVTVKAPIKIGDVIIENVCNTGINVVASKNSK